MTTYDLAEVRGFLAAVDERMDRCDGDEGTACANLDATLRGYAALCRDYREGVRAWGRAVFYGEAVCEPGVEAAFRAEGDRVRERAEGALARGRAAEASCYELEGRGDLEAALAELAPLLDHWLTPKLAVGPSARLRLNLTPEQIAAARARIAALPPLPADREPADPAQREALAEIRRKRTA